MARTGRPRVERVNVECASCGTMLERRKSEVDRAVTGRVFCDMTCRGRLGVKPRTGADQPCEQCGTPFYVQLSSPARRFCSRECNAAWQARNQVTRQCDYCGDSYTLRPSQAHAYRKLDRARFCTRRCMGLAAIKRPLDRMHNGKPAMLDDHGYVFVWEPDYSGLTRKGWVAEHRLVAEQMIGRPLTSDDEVHHINRLRDDNRPENLEVLDGLTHSIISRGQRQSDIDLLAEYIRRFGVLNQEDT